MPIENGDTVKVHYTGTLTDGQQFDSSRTPGREPLEFTVGKGEMIPGFEQAVKGHEVGDRFSVTIPCEQAYGTVDEKLLFTVERAQVPASIPAIARDTFVRIPFARNRSIFRADSPGLFKECS